MTQDGFRAVFRASALVVAGLWLVGCGGEPPIPPAPDASVLFADSAAILGQRASKDQTFREGPDSPLTEAERPVFAGLEYYAFDPSLRFPVYFQRLSEPEPITIITTSGKERPAVRAGHFEFEYQGARYRLTAFQLRDAGEGGYRELFVPFMDATTGDETYRAGRYLSLDVDASANGWYGLDFNLAYHPLCAYGRSDFVCPQTPAENRLPFAIRAGEKGRAHQPLPVDAAQRS